MRSYTNNNADIKYANLLKGNEPFPFFFTYGEKNYRGFEELELVDKFTEKSRERETVDFFYILDENIRINVRLCYTYSHGFCEWTVRFENTGNSNSKIISDVYSKISFEGENPRLCGILGDHENQYRPYSYDLTEDSVHFVSDSGRATHVNFPYFNLEYGSKGSMLAIGWAGTWTADFSYSDGITTYTARSVNNLNTFLKPGETIRTALFAVGDYSERDEAFAANYWRDWFIKYNLPKADSQGNDLQPFSTCCIAGDTGLPNSDGSISENKDTWRRSLEKMIKEDCKVDFRWFDAGWYIKPDLGSPVPYESGNDWWDTVGTWELDPSKWPGKTFAESTEFARRNGMKTLMWFEPERVTDPENLEKNFGYKKEWAIRCPGEGAVSNNIGIPECFEWTVGRLCKTLSENKVEMYREDNNCDPAKLWSYLDSLEDCSRTGITECKFIDGHYRMWDRLIACTLSYGGCGFVDSCASGGGRNDLESMRRGIPLLRSDSDRTTTALRLSMSHGFNRWIPFCGANTKEKLEELANTGETSPYIWRASYLPVLNVESLWVHEPAENFPMTRFGLNEWKRVKPFLLKEFYVHTPWHSKNDTSGFCAFSYYDSEIKKGVITAFRQETCEETELKITVPYADEQYSYILRDEDSGNETKYSGKELREGINIFFETPKSSHLIWISAV